VDRLAAGGDAELAVERERLALDRVRRDIEPFAHLREGEVGRQQRQEPQLGGGQPWGAGGGFPERVELGLQLVGLGWEEAEAGSLPEDVPDLPK
jgi:hypothetical protein